MHDASIASSARRPLRWDPCRRSGVASEVPHQKGPEARKVRVNRHRPRKTYGSAPASLRARPAEPRQFPGSLVARPLPPSVRVRTKEAAMSSTLDVPEVL